MKLKRGVLFLSVLMAIFFLSTLVFSQSSGDALSYTEDQTYFNHPKGLSEKTQSRQRQPWRQATWEERICHFIDAVRNGDRKAFLYVEYNLLAGFQIAKGYPTNDTKKVGVIWKLNNDAKKKNTTPMKILTKEDPAIRKNVVYATLSGLFNKDPRLDW
jgi:hypothetical protein